MWTIPNHSHITFKWLECSTKWSWWKKKQRWNHLFTMRIYGRNNWKYWYENDLSCLTNRNIYGFTYSESKHVNMRCDCLHRKCHVDNITVGVDFVSNFSLRSIFEKKKSNKENVEFRKRKWKWKRNGNKNKVCPPIVLLNHTVMTKNYLINSTCFYHLKLIIKSTVYLNNTV